MPPPAAFARLHARTRDGLYREAPDVESIRTVAGLERLCAVAARTEGGVSYRRLVDLPDVDRRTVDDSYLPTLAALGVLEGVTEHDNRRPRSVRLHLRDTGLVTAFGPTDAPPRGDPEQEARLADVAAFDHTARLARALAGDPGVRFWRGRRGEVDLAFDAGDRPVPVGVVTRAADRDATLDAVREFVVTYPASVGLLVAADGSRAASPVARPAADVVRLPLWLYLLCC